MKIKIHVHFVKYLLIIIEFLEKLTLRNNIKSKGKLRLRLI